MLSAVLGKVVERLLHHRFVARRSESPVFQFAEKGRAKLIGGKQAVDVAPGD